MSEFSKRCSMGMWFVEEETDGQRKQLAQTCREDLADVLLGFLTALRRMLNAVDTADNKSNTSVGEKIAQARKYATPSTLIGSGADGVDPRVMGLGAARRDMEAWQKCNLGRKQPAPFPTSVSAPSWPSDMPHGKYTATGLLCRGFEVILEGVTLHYCTDAEYELRVAKLIGAPSAVEQMIRATKNPGKSLENIGLSGVFDLGNTVSTLVNMRVVVEQVLLRTFGLGAMRGGLFVVEDCLWTFNNFRLAQRPTLDEPAADSART